jgi:hypothetical protein
MRPQPTLLFRALLPVLIMTIAAACHPDQKATLFTALPASGSGISFANQIEENIDYNILTYEYLYNGGGVAAGDLNNDGLTDLVFTGNMVPNKVYLNQGNLQFKDITEASGLAGRDRWKTGVVMAGERRRTTRCVCLLFRSGYRRSPRQ